MTANVTHLTPHIAIACGGTGGHLFPGVAIAESLKRNGCEVTLFVSEKQIDSEAAATAGLKTVPLPAVGLHARSMFSFARGLAGSWVAARKYLQSRPVHAVLAMGGFTSAGPVLAGRRFGAQTFLHESNTIPGRANRLAAWIIDEAFVGFPDAAPRLRPATVTVTGTPVRSQFQVMDPEACRAKLGLDPGKPVLLVMGGSQGARAINDFMCEAAFDLARRNPDLQVIHLTGKTGASKVKAAYNSLRIKSIVADFFTEMELAMGAATVAVSRAGASSLAELAAMRLPGVLVPYPSAADNHQFWNARSFETSGAAVLVEQATATPASFTAAVDGLLSSEPARDRMKSALARWHFPRASSSVADAIWRGIIEKSARGSRSRMYFAPPPPRIPGTPSAVA